MTVLTAAQRFEGLRLIGACAGLLLLASVLGTVVNSLRPAATRLSWVGDWEHHIETKAFHAGIPVTFLAGTQQRSADSSVVLLDARSPDLYEYGHIPRALNLPVGEVDQRLGSFASLLTPQTPILVYCGGADCGDALELAIKLRELGFTDLTMYPGGFAEWKEYGGAIRKGMDP